MSDYYPPVSFYFTVQLIGLGTDGDSSFLEVQGLTAERDVFELKEGGENSFVHRLPGRAKYGNLILKRGVLLPTSGLANWCKGILESNLDAPIVPNDLSLSLLNASGSPVMSWHFTNAWPVKWTVSDMSAEKNAIAIETLELAYAYFIKAPGAVPPLPAG
ncbi:phage tail protein [Massilia sp. TS11]|uniref:phage tail protein n=1 Tax=Massilia sp. TS11 TaxID=2908003 RepID=UPI001EDAB790|nr:phage tail protein [Massilia sp. TS11]MCG2584162.1 phage tail protein [Massilia sp. TS11]